MSEQYTDFENKCLFYDAGNMPIRYRTLYNQAREAFADGREGIVVSPVDLMGLLIELENEKRRGLPASMQEAFNSGDGSYKP